jgi:DNA-binding XRE family transcriptional regulator
MFTFMHIGSIIIIAHICEAVIFCMVSRIRELLEIRQLSPTQFADLIGVGRPVVSHILSERNKPSLEVVQKVISAFPDVSLTWLLSGSGPMLATAPATAIGLATSSVATSSTPVATESTQSTPPAPLREQPVATPGDGAIATARVARPTSRPLPPKFRPSATALPQPAPAPEQPTAHVTPAPPQASAIPAVPRPLAFTPAAVAAPIAPSESAAPSSLVETTASAPPSVAAYPTPGATTATPLPAPVPSPAAALSFLGEPGKAIRRIVIFYHDGSFSDYQPEGQP